MYVDYLINSYYFNSIIWHGYNKITTYVLYKLDIYIKMHDILIKFHQ